MTSDPRFETSFTPDYAELFAVAKASRRYHYTVAQRNIWWVPMIVFGALVFAFLTYAVEPIVAALEPLVGELLAGWAPVLLVAAMWALFIWLVGYRLGPAASARYIAKRKPPVPLRFSAGPDGMRWESEESRTWLNWAAIERVYVTKEAVCFLVGGFTHYVPRRAFASPLETKTFVETALAALTPEARSISEKDRSVIAVRNS